MNKIKLIGLILTLLCALSILIPTKTNAQYTVWNRSAYTDTLTFQKGVLISPYSNIEYESGYLTGIRSDNPTTNFGTSQTATLGDNTTNQFNLLYIAQGIEDYLDDAIVIDRAWLELSAFTVVGISLTADDTTYWLVGCHRLFLPWISTQATWNERMTGVSWGGAGASDVDGTWTNIFGAVGAYAVKLKWNQHHEDWNGRPDLIGGAVTEQEYPAGADTLSALAMTAPLDRLLFADSYTEIKPIKTGTTGANSKRNLYQLDVKPLIELWALEGGENYGMLIRIEETVGTASYCTVGTDNNVNTPANPRLIVIYQHALPITSSSIGSVSVGNPLGINGGIQN